MNDELTPEPTQPAANSIQLANGMDEADAAASRSGPDTEPPPSRYGPATTGGMWRDEANDIGHLPRAPVAVANP